MKRGNYFLPAVLAALLAGPYGAQAFQEAAPMPRITEKMPSITTV